MRTTSANCLQFPFDHNIVEDNHDESEVFGSCVLAKKSYIGHPSNEEITSFCIVKSTLNYAQV